MNISGIMIQSDVLLFSAALINGLIKRLVIQEQTFLDLQGTPLLRSNFCVQIVRLTICFTFLYACIYIKRNCKYSLTPIKQYFESISSDIIKIPNHLYLFPNVSCLLFLINACTKLGYTCVMNSVF